MNEAREQIEGLKELHGDDAATVRKLLQEADTLNEHARQNRIEAGRLLSRLRCNGGDWRRGTGCSAEAAHRLIQMFYGE